MNPLEKIKNTLHLIEVEDIKILWNGWNFSGGRDYGNWQEYAMYDKNGENIGFLQMNDNGTVSITGSHDDVYDVEGISDEVQNIIDRMLPRDDKAILAACGDEAGNIYLPCDYGDISREDVLKRLVCTADIMRDTITITQHGYDDFDIYFHNGDCSVRGTAKDILQELTDDRLDDFKKFIFKKDKSESDVPWEDDIKSYIQDDAEMFFKTNIQTIVNYYLNYIKEQS